MKLLHKKTLPAMSEITIAQQPFRARRVCAGQGNPVKPSEWLVFRMARAQRKQFRIHQQTQLNNIKH